MYHKPSPKIQLQCVGILLESNVTHDISRAERIPNIFCNDFLSDSNSKTV